MALSTPMCEGTNTKTCKYPFLFDTSISILTLLQRRSMGLESHPRHHDRLWRNTTELRNSLLYGGAKFRRRRI